MYSLRTNSTPNQSIFSYLCFVVHSIGGGHDHDHSHDHGHKCGGGHDDGHDHGHKTHDEEKIKEDHGHNCDGHDHGHGHGHKTSHGHKTHDEEKMEDHHGHNCDGHDHSHSKEKDHHDHGQHANETSPLVVVDGSHDDVDEFEKEKQRNVNLHAAYLHVLGDLAQSVAVLIGGTVRTQICPVLYGIIFLLRSIFIGMHHLLTYIIHRH